MDEEIIDLNPPTKEEPWCSACSSFSDYKRKWSTYPRANLDGGTYSENIEVPYCIECGNAMHYLSSCRLLVRSLRSIAFVLSFLSAMLFFILYEISTTTVVLWLLSLILSILISKVPITSRKALESHGIYLEKQKILNAEK